MTPEEMRKISRAIQEQDAIDFEEAGPKAPYDVVGYNGVRLESRWNVIDEFARMRRIVDGFSVGDVKKLAWICCDSKAQSCYIVGVRPGMFDDELKYMIADVFKAVGGGHNGISIEDGDHAFGGNRLADLDPDWEWGD
jgi:hypothetical protein